MSGTPTDPADELPPSATVEVVRDEGTLHVTLTGEIDVAGVAVVRDPIERALEPMPAEVAVDLSHVEFIDSSGLALLLTVAKQVGRVTLIAPSMPVRRLVELTGLSSTLQMTP